MYKIIFFYDDDTTKTKLYDEFSEFIDQCQKLEYNDDIYKAYFGGVLVGGNY
jgi:hypothetical protein